MGYTMHREGNNIYIAKSSRALDESGTYRLVYTIKLSKAIFVLHAFQKKSKHGIKTPTQEIELIKRRLKVAEELYKELIYGNKI